MSSVAVALFTRDLRVHDNPVLVAATEAARVVPLFVVDTGMGGYVCPNRARFLVESLADLDAGLRELGARLVVRRGEVAKHVREVAAEVDAEVVHIASDVSAYAQRRASGLADALAADGRRLSEHEAVITVVPPGAVAPSSGDHFKVFTPYHRHWAEYPHRRPLRPPKKLQLPSVTVGSIPEADELAAGKTSPDLAPGGEQQGRRRLDEWLERIKHYSDDHDSLAGDGTSRLSPYIHFGCLSASEIVQRAGEGSEGARAFVRQMAWRDFHHQTLAARPDAATADYRTRHDHWRHDEKQFEAWRQGRTGYPIVDAGMRQLEQEGWLHNRARLIVASFLTKTLYLDWRLGARHFLDLLVDGDIANNQLNWQWVAGTGTDTRPNRVLNPITQAKRFDPEGEYVRRYVPELASVAGGAVHEPWKLTDAERAKLDYPDPVVDAMEGYRRFRAARGLG